MEPRTIQQCEDEVEYCPEKCVFSRRFRRKYTTLTVASFFRQFNAIGPLFYSFVQHHQLKLRTSKTYSKRQNLVQNKNIDVQNLKNIGSLLVFFTRIFFGTMRLFFEVFWIPPKDLPFVCFDSLQHNGCQKIPPFTFFGAVTLFKNIF